MTDAEFAACEERIAALRRQWIEPLGLGRWSLNVECYRDYMDYEQATSCGPDSVAICDVNWQYLDARIHFNCSRLWALPDNDIERAVLHELCHMLLAETELCMRDGAEHHHIEHTATLLAQAFWWVRNQGESGDMMSVGAS